MAENKSKLPGCVMVILIAAGLYVLFYIVIALAKICVYLGYNISFYTDNLLTIPGMNPVAAWGILGLFIGSIAGVIIAVKKFKVSSMLLLYPVGITVAFLVIMILINKPGQYNAALVLPDAAAAGSNAVDSTRNTLKYYYTVTADVVTHISPSFSSAKSFVLNKGNEVEIVERGLYDTKRIEWLKIRYNYKEAYVSIKHVRFSRTAY